MYLLNHCSVQTEFSDIIPPETKAIPNLHSKILLQSFLLPALIFITLCFAVPTALSQETTDSDLGQSFEEYPLAESDPELGLDEDPLSESDSETVTDEGTLEETTTEFASKENLMEEASPELGIEKDPLAESNPEQVFKENQLQKASPETVSAEELVLGNEGELGFTEDQISGESDGIDQQEGDLFTRVQRQDRDVVHVHRDEHAE